MEPLIRSSLALGYSVRMIARAVGCSDGLVQRVARGPRIERRREEEAPRQYVSIPARVRYVEVPVRPMEKQEMRVFPDVDSPASRVQRALRHWLKNDDMEAAEVAEMYDVSTSALHAARKRAVGGK